MGCRLDVLGPLRFDHPELVARPRVDRRFELLTVLACSEGVVGRHTLASLFWTDSDRAQANLRQLASRLRAWRLSGLDILPEGLAWVGGSDVGDFRRAIREERWADAWSLYRGDLLEGHSGNVSPEFGEWLDAERRSYREQAYAAGLSVADAWAENAPAESARVLRRLLELNPYGEDALDAYLRVAPRAGLVDVAIDVARHLEDRLRTDLGIELRADVRERLIALREPSGMPPVDPPWALSAEFPESPTPCIGREREIETALAILNERQARMLTLVGPGGIGKTRVSLEIARAHARELAHGGAFVPLASAASTEDLITSVAIALGVTQLGDGDASVQVVRALRDREFLLVLDNLEHLAASASTLGAWLAQCPGLQILATSRRPLGSPWERLMVLQGLPAPVAPESPAFEEAHGVAVFLHHARRRDSTYTLDRAAREALVDFLDLVGGVPLAIELAAAWTPTLPLSTIADEARRDLDALGGTAAVAESRHRGMRAVFDGSWSCLDPAERSALACAAVFRGGFTAEAFLDVADAKPAILAALTNACLVQRRGERYDLHELIRQYAGERLRDDPDLLDRAYGRHVEHFASSMRSLGRDVQGGPRQVEALAKVGAEMPNLRVAWQRAVERRNERAIAASIEPLWWYLEIRGLHREGLEWFEGAESAVDAPEVLAPLLARRGAFAHRLRQLELCRELSERSLQASEAAGIAPDWTAVINLAILPWYEGDLRAAWEAHEEAAALAERLGDTRLASAAEEHLASIASQRGNLDEAERRHGEALRWARLHGDRWGLALTLCNLGHMYADSGRVDEAHGVLTEALELARRIGFNMIIGAAALQLAEMARGEGRFAQCVELYEESIAASRRMPSAESVEIEALLGIGAAHADQGCELDAERLLRDAADGAVEAGDAELEARAWEALVRLCSSSGATDRAYLALLHLEGLDVERARRLRASLPAGAREHPTGA